MKKLLLIQDTISNYRVPVYNIIAEHYNLTLLYSNGDVPEGLNFTVIHHNSKRIGPFKLYKRGFARIIKDYDVVLFLFNVMEVSIVWEIIKNKITSHRKFIPWGIGVPASYNVKYDDPQKRVSSFLTRILIKLSDAVVFYSDYPVKKYTNLGLESGKMFVAHNTVEVCPYNDMLSANTPKDIILFVGSLYKQKGLGVLLEAYTKALRQNPDIIPLYIIGGGAEYDEIVRFVSDNQLGQKIYLKGPIYDEQVLSTYFLMARVCISPNQAGLSVQKSMGYGVPFVTRKDAITGGEIFDIDNNIRGVLYQDDSQLVDILLDINNNPQKYLEMGENGKFFYRENRTIQIMAQGVINAINYVL